MDNRVVGAIAVLGVALLGGVAVFAMMPGDSGPEAVEEPAGDNGEAEQDRADGTPVAEPKEPTKASVKGTDLDGGEAEQDPEYQARAKAHRENRERRNLEWRNKSTAAAQEWVSANVDEATALQVMGSVTKFHDTVAQSRADLEDGVIDPRTLREEMEMAREDFRVELENFLGPEKKEAFMAATADARTGGF